MAWHLLSHTGTAKPGGRQTQSPGRGPYPGGSERSQGADEGQGGRKASPRESRGTVSCSQAVCGVSKKLPGKMVRLIELATDAAGERMEERRGGLLRPGRLVERLLRTYSGGTEDRGSVLLAPPGGYLLDPLNDGFDPRPSVQRASRFVALSLHFNRVPRKPTSATGCWRSSELLTHLLNANQRWAPAYSHDDIPFRLSSWLETPSAERKSQFGTGA